MENFKLGKTITLSFLILASSWQGTDQLLHQTYSPTPNYIQDGIFLAHHMEEQTEILIIAITGLRRMMFGQVGRAVGQHHQK